MPEITMEKGGADTLTFSLENPKETTDVVIRTEDFRGYMVSERVWEGVEAYLTEKFPLSVSSTRSLDESIDKREA